MENAFHLQNPAPQRHSEAVTMAPTASMIDPNLESQSMSVSHMSHDFGTPQMQRNAALMVNHRLQQILGDQSGRALPSMQVDDASMDEAYVEFVMYCNPAIPDNVDTTELRKAFRSPPKSDGKTFSPFVLFGLISKLEAKEIKTWTQLVTELGVELPDAAKNQSTQKVQQYAVRLKRWLHAFHVDAFFHYYLGISNPYYTERPSGHEQLPETARDGVPPEEDLALRALLPEWRPKRGRRKAEENESEGTPNKRSQFRRSVSAEFLSTFEDQYSAQPSSAVPWSAHPQAPDTWGAAQVAIAPKAQNTGQTPLSSHLSAQSAGHQGRWRLNERENTAQPAGQQLRWRLNERENVPLTPYPQSAITPRQSYSVNASFGEPKSANPASATGKSPSRARKRHGPAVSSAWPASNNTTTGKLRGRPPSNRSVQDGPFSTFPANPSSKETPLINIGTPIQATNQTPKHETNEKPLPNLQPALTGSPKPPAPEQPTTVRKPSKLQLQVPEHAGGPVRLATPPRVLINGESNRAGSSLSFSNHEQRRSSADFFTQIDEGFDDDDDDDGGGAADDDGTDETDAIDWKKRALTLRRKLQEKEDELKAMKRRVLDAVM